MATALTPGKGTRSTRGAQPANATQIPALAAGDVTGNTYANTGREVVVVQTDANARTIIFKDRNGTALPSIALAASKIYVFGPMPVYEYGSTVTFTVNNAAVLVTVVTLNELDSVQVNTGG